MNNYFPLEVHLTVESGDTEEFKLHCEDLGIKSILIETENGEIIGEQLMTSSTHHNEDNFKERIKYIKEYFDFWGYKVIRQKHEIKPQKLRHSNHIYYESHIRLKLLKYSKMDLVKELSKKYNFHLSKNLLKTNDNKFKYQMVTYRDNNTNLKSFNKHNNIFLLELMKNNINWDKIEIEECIFDSNISVDNNWI